MNDATSPNTSASTGLRTWFIILAIGVALAYAAISGPLLKPYLTNPTIAAIPYLRNILTSCTDLVVLTLLAALAAQTSPLRIIGLSGLRAPFLKPLLWMMTWFAPALVVCLNAAPVSDAFTAADFGWLAIGGPFFEEVGFRGIAIGVLMRLAGVPFLPAALFPALLFGLAHFANGHAPVEIAGIVAITALGGLVFGWLFVRWGFNLWPAILLHAGLNGLWLVFDLGENAIGGWLGNALRFGVVVIAIASTFLMTRKAPSE